MKLYYAPYTCALAIWISLEWLEVDYQVEKVELNSAAYKKINPLGQVPTLEDEHGFKTQLAPILEYLIEKYPQYDLGPDLGLEDHFRYREIAAFLTGDLHPAYGPLFQPKRYTTKTDPISLKAIQDQTRKEIPKLLSYLNSLLGKSPLP